MTLPLDGTVEQARPVGEIGGSDHRELVASVERRIGWGQLKPREQERLRALLLAAESPLLGIVTTVSVAATGERIGLSRSTTNHLLEAARDAALLGFSHDGSGSYRDVNGNRLRGPSTWIVWPSDTPQPRSRGVGKRLRSTNGSIRGSTGKSVSVSGRVNGMGQRGQLHTHTSPKEKSVYAKLDFLVSQIERGLHGSPLTVTQRALLVACLDENKPGVRACYEEVTRRGQGVGLFLTMLSDGDHHTRVYTEPGVLCAVCGHERSDTRDVGPEVGVMSPCHVCAACRPHVGGTREFLELDSDRP